MSIESSIVDLIFRFPSKWLTRKHNKFLLLICLLGFLRPDRTIAFQSSWNRWYTIIYWLSAYAPMGAPPPPPYQAIISGKRSSRMSVHPSFLNFLNSGDTRTKGELVQENSIFSTKLLPVIFLSLYCLYNYVYVDNVKVFVFLLKISPKKRVQFVEKKIWQAPLSIKHPPSNKCTSF